MKRRSGVTVSADPWVWRALFADGSVLDEYADEHADEYADDAPDGQNGRGWAAVAAQAEAHATRLTSIVLLPTRRGLQTHVVSLSANCSADGSGARIFRRRSLTVSPLTGEEVGARPDPITAIEVNGVYTFLFSDGSVVVSDDLNAV